MDTYRIGRLAPLTGVLYAALFIIAMGMQGSAPSSDAPGAQVIAFYQSHHTAGTVSCFVLVASAIAFVFFAGALRQALRRPDDRDGDWLPTVAFGGGVAYAIALSLFAVGQAALLKGAELGNVEMVRTLNVINSASFFPAMVAVSVVLLAGGTAALHTDALPRWLAWVATAVGAVAVLGPLGFAAFFLLPLWSLVAGVILNRRAVNAPAAAAGDAATSRSLAPSSA
ncbi:MAG: hypothetical protein QOI86_1435 [Actinomycetota bacterium]|jgi:hypothetical protein|nr:hypothetical protein [Actinomycetota bacterium]